MYLTIRIVHVLFGGLWLGIACSSAVFLMPMLKSLGADAGKAAATLQGRVAIIPVVATLTILSGFWLYWKLGLAGPLAGTVTAMVIGTGAVLGVVALLIGAIVISRSLAQATVLMGKAQNAPEAERAQLMSRAMTLRNRGVTAGRIVAVLLVLTVILMAAGFHV